LLVSSEDRRQGVLDLVAKAEPDLIVAASHGQTFSRHATHGSLTEYLLSYASLPVWIIQNLHGPAQRFENVVEAREVVRAYSAGLR
jgi:hypothetical protein